MTPSEPAFDALLLAGGAGSRFGGGKLMAPFAGEPLIAGALRAALAAPVRRVILVTGADERVGPAAAAVAAGLGHTGRLAIVHAADHAYGLSFTLRRGLTEIEPGASGVFVFLGDMPRIPHGLAARLAAEVVNGAPASAPCWRGRRGHPVLFGSALLPALSQAHGDEGARALLAELGGRLALVQSPDDGVLFDVDRPEDLRSPPASAPPQ